MQRNDPDRPDPKLERTIASWLSDEPDRVPDDLVEGALSRSRASNQRLSWTARWHQRGTVPASQPVVAGAALTAAVAVVALVLGVSLWRAAPDQGTISPTAVASPDSSASVSFDGRIERTIELDTNTVALGYAFGTLWVGDDTGRLLRINNDGSVAASIDLDGVACGPIHGAATSVVLATCGRTGLKEFATTVRIDPERNVVADVYDDGAADGFGATAMRGLIWFISDANQGRLTGVDAVTGEHVRDVTVGGPIRYFVASLGSLWVSRVGRPAVLRVDPESGDVIAEIALSGDAGFLTAGQDTIWVAEPHQWLVARLDPVANQLAAEYQAAPGVDQLAIGSNGLVWALTDDQLLAIDPATGEEVDRLTVPTHVASDGVANHVFVVDETGLWFADGSSLVRVRTPRR
jgi:sugar lactone lactonase YvrE